MNSSIELKITRNDKILHEETITRNVMREFALYAIGKAIVNTPAEQMKSDRTNRMFN